MTTKKEAKIELKLIDEQLKESGTVSLTLTVDNSSENLSYLYELDKYQKAGTRRGIASCKNRSAVRGGGAKPHKQKGTGNARRGTNNTPLRRGGGVIFGPSPRDFSYKLDKNVIRYGYQQLFNEMSKKTYVIEQNILLADKKTNDVVKKLLTLKIQKTNTVTVVVEEDILKKNKAWKNIKNLKMISRKSLSVNDVMHSEFLLVQKESILKLEESYFG